MKTTLKAFCLIAALVVIVPAELLFVGVPNVPVTIRENRYISTLKVGTPRSQLVAGAQSLRYADAIEAAADTPKAATYNVTFYNWLRFMVESGDSITMTFSPDGKLVSWKARPVRLY